MITALALGAVAATTAVASSAISASNQKNAKISQAKFNAKTTAIKNAAGNAAVVSITK